VYAYPSRYDGVVVPYSGNKSGISYSDVDRWRTTTIEGSDLTYSSESSVTLSSLISSSIVSSSRTHSSRIETSTCRSSAANSRQPKAPSVALQHLHSGIHYDPPDIGEHCCRDTPPVISPITDSLLVPCNRSTSPANSWPHQCTPRTPTRTSLCLPCCLSSPHFLSRCP
jgi:hypothetical protein